MKLIVLFSQQTCLMWDWDVIQTSNLQARRPGCLSLSGNSLLTCQAWGTLSTGHPASIYTTTGLHLDIISSHKPHHHDKAETPSGEFCNLYSTCYSLTHSLHRAVLLDKLTSSRLLKKFTEIYGTRRSLLHSQVPITCPCLGQIKPVHTLTSHFLKIHLNIILSSAPSSSKWSLSLRFPHQNPLYTPVLSPTLDTCPAHLILLDFITRTILGEEYRSLCSSLCSFLHSPLPSSLLSPNILRSTLFSNTLNVRSSLNVCNQVSHPYKTTDKIVVLCILIFIFLDSKLEDKRFCSKR